jgi:hypothetical protein
MSAFVVSKKHLATIANFAVKHATWLDDHSATEADYNHIYKTLAAENVRSVCARYPDVSAAEYADFLRPTLKGKTPPVSPVAILKLCDCLSYQSNETEDWETTAACKLIKRIRNSAVYLIPGYEEAPWAIH